MSGRKHVSHIISDFSHLYGKRMNLLALQCDPEKVEKVVNQLQESDSVMVTGLGNLPELLSDIPRKDMIVLVAEPVEANSNRDLVTLLSHVRNHDTLVVLVNGKVDDVQVTNFVLYASDVLINLTDDISTVVKDRFGESENKIYHLNI